MARYGVVYFFYLSLIFICKCTSEDCVHPFCADSDPDFEETPYFSGDSKPKSSENTATMSVPKDSSSTCSNPLTKITGGISTRSSIYKKSTTVANVKNGENTGKVPESQSGSFKADPKMIFLMIFCGILMLPFIDAVYRCIFHRKKTTSEVDPNATFISYSVSEATEEDIRIRDLIVERMNRVQDFFVHPFRTLVQQIREPVNVSTVEIVEIPWPADSEIESPPERNGLDDSSHRDLNDDQTDSNSMNSTEPFVSAQSSISSHSTSYATFQETSV